jgi:hypothetical protein
MNTKGGKGFVVPVVCLPEYAKDTSLDFMFEVNKPAPSVYKAVGYNSVEVIKAMCAFKLSEE